MELIWCLKHGKARGFHNELPACIACNCRIRKRCKPYAETPVNLLLAATREANRNGHSATIGMPLFEITVEERAD